MLRVVVVVVVVWLIIYPYFKVGCHELLWGGLADNPANLGTITSSTVLPPQYLHHQLIIIWVSEVRLMSHVCLICVCVHQSNFIIDGIRNNEKFENLILGPHSSRREKIEFDHSTVLSSPKKALHVGRWWWQHSNYPLHMYSIRAFGRYVLVSHQPRRTARLIYGIMFQMSSKKVNARDHKCW